MKVNYKIVILLVFFFIIITSRNVFSQIIVEGKQTRENQSIIYSGVPVFVPQKCKIVSIEGDKTSFALRIENITIYQFYYENNEYTPPAYSTVIEPGLYVLYPNLSPNNDSVWVKIKLEFLE